jgi:enoyl-[acyl-carrier-protein] reductase (NADH)
VMMSDFTTKTSGEVIRVDGGFHAVAAASGSPE